MYQEETLEPFAFQNTESIFTKDSTELVNCFVTHVKDYCLARCGVIDTPAKGEQFLAFMRQAATHKRICVVQPNMPHEWDVIEREHNLLLQLNQSYEGEILHLNMPSFVQTGETSRDFLYLSLLQNREAWASYCKWINDEFNRVSRSFLPAMIDEYQLEAKFKDFSHEVKSSIFLDTKGEIVKTTLKLNDLENSGNLDAIKDLEKQLIQYRETLYRLMKAQEAALEQVAAGISKIEKQHPELLGLKRKVIVLKMLLSAEDHPRALLLHQLLNLWSGTVTVVSADDGLGKVSFDFALRQALTQCAFRFSPWDLLNMVLNWNELEEELADFYQQKGAEDFYFWLHVPSRDKEEDQKRKRLIPLYVLQTKFIENLHNFALPIIQANVASPIDSPPYPELISLTPHFRALENQQLEALIQTAKPPSFTPQGTAFYAPFFKN